MSAATSHNNQANPTLISKSTNKDNITHETEGYRPHTPRYIQAVQFDAATGAVTTDTIHIKSSWRYDPPSTLPDTQNVVIAPYDDGPKRHRLAFMEVNKELRDFRSTRELCQVLAGTIEAHEALYTKAGIIHGDISAGTVGITYE